MGCSAGVVCNRAAALVGTICFLSAADPAQAGINVRTSIGPAGGDIIALAIDPVTPSTLYVATDGLYKSTDAGATWNPANAGLPSNIALAIDPVTPSTLYAGTTNDGVFKSTDAGATWEAANAGLDTEFLVALAIDPVTSSTVYASVCEAFFATYCSACAGSAVFKSTDAGATWEAASAGLTYTYVGLLAVDPNTPSTLYAGSRYPGPSFYKSTNAGATWEAADAGLPDRVTALVMNPVTSHILYVGTYGAGVFKSTDAGANWSAINAGLVATHITALANDPVTPSTLYAGTLGDGVFSLQQVSPTATPTSTPTSTSISTPPMNTDGGGCGIAPSQWSETTGSTLVLLAALAMIVARRLQ